MSIIRGFDVAYTYRGSWYAHVSRGGRVFAEVPVAWVSDYVSKPPQKPELGVWFKEEGKAATILAAGASFPVALTSKNSDGSGSSDNIRNLFEVTPLGPTDEEKKILCRVDGLWTPEIT
jgi:hypothetical protein